MIIQCIGEKVELVYAQEKPWQKCSQPVPVLMASDFGKMFPLSKDSYFTAWQVVPSGYIDEDLGIRCPKSYFGLVEAVAVEGRIQLEQRRAVTAAAQAYMKERKKS